MVEDFGIKLGGHIGRIGKEWYYVSVYNYDIDEDHVGDEVESVNMDGESRFIHFSSLKDVEYVNYKEVDWKEVCIRCWEDGEEPTSYCMYQDRIVHVSESC